MYSYIYIYIYSTDLPRESSTLTVNGNFSSRYNAEEQKVVGTSSPSWLMPSENSRYPCARNLLWLLRAGRTPSMSRQIELSSLLGDDTPSSRSDVQTTTALSSTTTVADTTAATSNTSSELGTDPTNTSSESASPSSTTTHKSSSAGSNALTDNSQSTVIILSTIMSIVGVCLLAGLIYSCIHCRRRRLKLFNRGITPIDDEEIERWKGNRNEKDLEEATGQTRLSDRKSHQKQESVSSTKKPASVIVYARQSEERSPRSPPVQGYYGKLSLDGRKMSLDKELPFTPIQARAPNAREGLTDKMVPGDEPFIPGPKRQTSRLSKAHSPRHPRQAHARNKSSRSSASLNNYLEGYGGYAGYSGYGGYESDADMTHRASHEQQTFHSRHSRMFSSSSIPPRLSLSDDWPSHDVISPRPLIRREDIGRAIG